MEMKKFVPLLLILLFIIPIVVGITLDEFDISGYTTIDYSDKNVFHVHIYDPNATTTYATDTYNVPYSSGVYYYGDLPTNFVWLYGYLNAGYSSNDRSRIVINGVDVVKCYGLSNNYHYIEIWDLSGNRLLYEAEYSSNNYYYFRVNLTYNGTHLTIYSYDYGKSFTFEANITSVDVYLYSSGTLSGSDAYVKITYPTLSINSVINYAKMYLSNIQFLQVNDTTIEVYNGSGFNYIYNEQLYDVELYYCDTGYNLTLKTDKSNYEYFLEFPQGGFYAELNTTNTSHVVIEYSIPETKPTENIIMSSQLDYMIAYLFIFVISLFAILLHEKSVLPIVFIGGMAFYNIIPYWIGIIVILAVIFYIIYLRKG